MLRAYWLAELIKNRTRRWRRISLISPYFLLLQICNFILRNHFRLNGYRIAISSELKHLSGGQFIKPQEGNKTHKLREFLSLRRFTRQTGSYRRSNSYWGKGPAFVQGALECSGFEWSLTLGWPLSHPCSWKGSPTHSSISSPLKLTASPGCTWAESSLACWWSPI